MINITGYKNDKLPNFAKVLKEIEKEHKKIVDVETAYENRKKHAEMWTKATAGEYENVREQIKADENLYAKLCAENDLHNAVIRCLWNNAYIELMNDVLPAIIEYLKKINGKQYGEKTADKMREYFRNEYNLGVYLSSSYYSSEKREITIYFLDEKGFSHGGKDLEIYTRVYDNTIINANNTVTMDNLNNVSDFAGRGLIPYIDNPREHVKMLIKLKEKARKQLETAKETINNFNHIAPAGVHELPYISAYVRGGLLD